MSGAAGGVRCWAERSRGPADGPGCVSAGSVGRGAPRAAGGREGAAAGGALGPCRPGRGGGRELGAGPRRRRAGLAPDLTFWVRACVPEARWGRGWGREAVREVPGWLASAPFSLPLLPAPEGTGPPGPRREEGGVLRAGKRRSRPGPGDTSLSGPWGLPGEGTWVVFASWSSLPPAPPGSPGGVSSEIGGGSLSGLMVPPSPSSP